MNYTVYKLDFHTGVHFGSGMLSEGDFVFCADTLFSAIYLEALKTGKSDLLYQEVQNGNLLLSDAFPYCENRYYIPKPMLYVETGNRGESSDKKKLKKLRYLPIESLNDFLQGRFLAEICVMDEFGISSSQVMAAVRTESDTLPFVVGDYKFNENCGLYLIAGYKGKRQIELLEELLESLSYTGIGGKRSCGKGKFDFKTARGTDCLLERMDRKSDRYMLLSTALPQEEEMKDSLEGASYLLQKRSGFVYSETFAEEQIRKRDMFTMQAGSCFRRVFQGAVYDVGEGGTHPVYRYAKAMFLGI